MGATAAPGLLEVETFFFGLLVIEVGDVQRYPYPMSGKLTQNFKEGKKSVSVFNFRKLKVKKKIVRLHSRMSVDDRITIEANYRLLIKTKQYF